MSENPEKPVLELTPRERGPIEIMPQLTRRPISSDAEKWIEHPIPCLDYGWVSLVDYMGNDVSVEQAARVSYGAGTRKVSETRGLIRYLRRHKHTTPFEMVEFKFNCGLPIFVARQWIRHRTANVNEYSGRYSIMRMNFYTPEHDHFARQSSSNNQGRDETSFSWEFYNEAMRKLQEGRELDAQNYEWLIGEDVARELARIDLPLSTYTQWYWKIDLHNLMHFLALRLDDHAQYEVRVYAQAIAQIVKDTVPFCWEAFEDYQLHSLELSRLEIAFVKDHFWPMTDEEQARALIQERFKNKRETNEFIAKLKRLGLLI